jgi:hypothetical protein
MNKNIFLLVLVFLAGFSLKGQNLKVIHQKNGGQLRLPLESMDSVRFKTSPAPATQLIFQNNGNVLNIPLQAIDSITYLIPKLRSLATVVTNKSAIQSSSAVYAEGEVTKDGGASITERGFCWNTTPNPTIANNRITSGTGLGVFNAVIQPLSPATRYYIRAYAINSNGTAYGNQDTVVTNAASTAGNKPTVTSVTAQYNDSLIALSGGNITDDGGLAVTARGVCWAIGKTPTINNSRSLDGAGAGNFTSVLTDLLPNTSYFFRAYATNDAGTAYGISYSITTKDFATLKTDSIQRVFSSPIAAATISSNGGLTPIECGFCWSKKPYPGIFDQKVPATLVSNKFSTKLNGIYADTTYYVRAYVRTKIGVSYGNQIKFTGAPAPKFPAKTVTCHSTPFVWVDVTNPVTGKTWMDRNLGARRVASEVSDSFAWGDLYQWGRGPDGHQCTNAIVDTTASAISSLDQPGHGKFIGSNIFTLNHWRDPLNPNLWQGVNGINNPCPQGYRIPSETEWDEERKSWISNDSTGALSSPLKLRSYIVRNYDGIISRYSVYFTRYYSSSYDKVITITDLKNTKITPNGRTNLGREVRCIKD